MFLGFLVYKLRVPRIPSLFFLQLTKGYLEPGMVNIVWDVKDKYVSFVYIDRVWRKICPSLFTTSYQNVLNKYMRLTPKPKAKLHNYLCENWKRRHFSRFFICKKKNLELFNDIWHFSTIVFEKSTFPQNLIFRPRRIHTFKTNFCTSIERMSYLCHTWFNRAVSYIVSKPDK
jgi:hypothetical protein